MYVYIVHCHLYKSVSMYCIYVNCFCTVWSTLSIISLTKAHVLWWCDNKSDWFDLIQYLFWLRRRVMVMLALLTCLGPLKLSGHHRWREEARLFFKRHRRAEEQQSLCLFVDTQSHSPDIVPVSILSTNEPTAGNLKSLCPAKRFTRVPQCASLCLCFM